MMWSGWVAALGGVLSVIGGLVASVSWLSWLGGIVAIIFGIVAAMPDK